MSENIFSKFPTKHYRENTNIFPIRCDKKGNCYQQFNTKDDFHPKSIKRVKSIVLGCPIKDFDSHTGTCRVPLKVIRRVIK